MICEVDDIYHVEFRFFGHLQALHLATSLTINSYHLNGSFASEEEYRQSVDPIGTRTQCVHKVFFGLSFLRESQGSKRKDTASCMKERETPLSCCPRVKRLRVVLLPVDRLKGANYRKPLILLNLGSTSFVGQNMLVRQKA